jgi:hypothetical protein
MNETADSAHVADFIQHVAKRAADENVAGKKRFDDTHRPAPRRAFQSQARMKNFEAQILRQTGCGQMFVFRLRARAIPSWWVESFHGSKNQEWEVSLLRMQAEDRTARAAPPYHEEKIICIGETLIFVPCTVITFSKDLNIRAEDGFSNRIIS